MIDLRIYGTPAPQGSKKAYIRGKRAVLVESSNKVRPWRDAIIHAVQSENLSGMTIDTAVSITVTFMFQRPKHHYGRRQKQPYLRENAPSYVSGKPDLDKLLRSTGDGLVEARLLTDDNIIVRWSAEKIYCDSDVEPGAVISIKEM